MLDKNLIKICCIIGFTIVLLFNPMKTKVKDKHSSPTNTPSLAKHNYITEEYCETIDKNKCTYLKSVLASSKSDCKYQVSEYIFCDLKKKCNKRDEKFDNIKKCMEK